MKIDLKKIGRKRLILYVICFVLAILILIGYIYISQEIKRVTTITSQPTEQKVEVKQTLITSQIINDSILFPVLSADGRYLYYQDFEDGFFYKLDTTNNSTNKISRELRMVSDTIWSPDRTKAIFIVSQDNHFFEVYNSPFSNPALEDKTITNWLYDFNKDTLVKIGNNEILDISWAPDSNSIIYHYIKFDKKINDYASNIAIYYINKKVWDTIKEGISIESVSVGFIDLNNIYFLEDPTDAFGCAKPTNINITTKKEIDLINKDSCIQDISIYPLSNWAFYSDSNIEGGNNISTIYGFVNLNSKNKFILSEDINYIINDSLSKDGRYIYATKNNSNQILKLDLYTNKITTINSEAPLGSAEQIIISPDAKTVYFLVEQDGLKYLYKTQINQ